MTFWDKVVSEYMAISLPDVQDLDMVDYLALRREAFISEMSKSEKGKKYLTDAWYYEQTEADYEGLMEVQQMIAAERGA